MDNSAPTYNLRPLWDDILEIYKECRAICERHRLRMFGAFGTELGALRHHGFIPWDDDFDVLMPRPDYEKFKKYAQEELPSHLKWHSFDTDPNYNLIFGKVQDERPDVLERIKRETNLNIEQGVFVDFFPMDGLPATTLGCMLWHVRRSLLRRTQDYGYRALSFKTLVWHLMRPFYRVPKDAHGQLRQLESFITRIDYETAKNTSFVLDIFKFPHYIYKREWFDSVQTVPFENTTIDIPVGADPHLRVMYGDYLQLPPPDQRKPSHQTIS